MYYTLMYLNDCGDTIARDYFDDIKKAEAFMDELIKTYEEHGADTGLRLEDSGGKCIREYYADECKEDAGACDNEDCETEDDIVKNENRLKILLYNAISLLADKTIGPDDLFADWMWELCEELGTTPEELKRFGVDFDEMF